MGRLGGGSNHKSKSRGGGGGAPSPDPSSPASSAPDVIPALESTTATAAAARRDPRGRVPSPPRSSGGGGSGSGVGNSRMTSGISTLFRRQPSPSPEGTQGRQILAAAALPSGGGGGGGGRGRGGGRDPVGVHATRGQSAASSRVAASLGGGGGGEGECGVGVGVGVGVDPLPSNNNAVIGIIVGGLTPGDGGVGGARGGPPPSSSSSSSRQQWGGQRPPPSPGRDAPSSGGGGRAPSSSSSRRAFGYDDDDDDRVGAGPASQSRSYSPDVVRLKSSLYTATADSNDNSSSADLLDQIASSATHDDDDDYPPFGDGDGDDDDDDYGGSDYYGGSEEDRESDDSDRAAGQGAGRGRGGGGKKAPPKNSRSNLKKGKIARISRSADHVRLPRRYRGFSTSMSSLFLDESIVCGAVSCWGLLLSSRTEHLLDERNLKRGLTRRGVGGEAGRGKDGGKRAPSFVLSVAWIVTILGGLVTYAVWGFDSGQAHASSSTTSSEGGSYYDNGYFDDGGDYNNNQAVQNVDDYYGANDYGYDDGANRRLIHVHEWRSPVEEGSSTGGASNVPISTASSARHSFDGIMKMRDYKEHVFDPSIDAAHRAYLRLMRQFDADEYRPRSLEEEESAGSSSAQQVIPKDEGQQVRTVLIVVFLLLLGIIGRRRRMRTRFAILRARAQDDHLYYASILTKQGTNGSLATPDNTVMENFHEREDKYDGACSHTLFGCYPVDTIPADYADYLDDDDDQTATTAGQSSTHGGASARKKRKGGDFMGRTMTAIFGCCCGVLCSCWCQLFSICSLAQEARETRLLVPPSMQRIDLITHQPFSEYAKDVNNVRRRFMERANRTWMQHLAALSLLSRYLLLGFVLIAGFVTMTMLLHPMNGFGQGDAIILIATFSQSLVVLFIVFGIFHRSDLSFDAVVKFFSVGFCVCVVTGFVIEGFLVVAIQWTMYISYYPPHWIWGDDYDAWLAANDRILKTSAELVFAYIVAALVEELCKYYGFRFLEHPDLVFITGLDRTAKQAMNSGGLHAYKFDSQLVSEFSRSQDSDSLDSRGRKKMSRKRRSKMLRPSDDDDDVEPELRTLQQQGAAITTGMISVAVGLACAENFLYVFFLGGTQDDLGDVSVRLTILLFRSMFPIHALGAAMQSINMIRKFIEERHCGERNIGVGRIIFPAVLLHGTFDAVLMCVNAYIDSSYDRYYNNGGTDDDATWVQPYNELVVNLIACMGILGVMAISFGWYSYQNKMQMLRLAKIDMNRSRYGRGGFSAPNLV